MKKVTMASTLLCICSTHQCFAENMNSQKNTSTEVITVIGTPLYSEQTESIISQTNMDADFGDQIRALPGVSINRNGSITAVIQYRGLFGDRVGVSIDGVDIAGAGPNAMDSPLSHVLPEPGLNATLHRGIVPVSAGVQTLGGQISIASPAQSLFAANDGFQGSMSASSMAPGNAQQYQGNVFYATKNNFLSATLLHQQRDTRESGNGSDIPNSHFLRNGGKLRAGHEFGKHQFDISYQWLNTNESGTPSLAMDINFIDAAWYRLGYHYSTDNQTSVTINVFGNSNQHIMDNFSQRPVMMPSMTRANTTDSIAQGLDATLAIPLNSGELQVGVNLQQRRNNSTILNPNNAMFAIENYNSAARDIASIFAQWEYDSEVLSAVTGLRYSSIQLDAEEVASSLTQMNDAVATLVDNFNAGQKERRYYMLDAAASLFYHLSSDTDIVAGISQKNRAPTFFERFTWLPLGITGGLADGFNYIGNLELTKETARQIEIGADFRTASWTLSPRLFYQDIDDYIAGSPSTNMAANMFSSMMTGQAPFVWTNTDATIVGADFLIQGQLAPNILVNAVLTIQHGNRDDINDALFRIAPERLMTSFDWDTELLSTSVLLSLTSELVGRQGHTSSLQNERDTAGYGLLHLSAQWQLHPKIQLTTQVNNIFDKFYAPHTAGVNRVAQEDVAVGEPVPNPGREWQISLSYQF